MWDPERAIFFQQMQEVNSNKTEKTKKHLLSCFHRVQSES